MYLQLERDAGSSAQRTSFLTSEDHMSSTHRSRKRTAFVPRIIFQTAAVVGVLPLCVGCVAQPAPPAAGVAELGFTGDASSSLGVANMGFDGSKGDAATLGVANMAFDGGNSDGGLSVSVANIGFDGGGADVGLSVAAMGFDGSTGDSGLSVAAMGFDASDDAALGVALEAFGTSKS
jgi:hypothetical protein